jgi:translocation and assembly module TamA
LNLVSLKRPTTTLFLAFLLSLGLGCSSTVHPPGAARDGQHEVVSSLRLIGVKSIKKRELIDGLAMRGPQGWLSVERTYFDPLTHRLDIKRIVAFYREQGFLSAQVVKAEVIKKGRIKRRLVYTIEEGPRTRLSKIEVELAPTSKLDTEDLANFTAVTIGDPFVYEKYEEASNELLRSLLLLGYAFAEVSGRVEVQEGKEYAALHYEVQEGPLALFGPLTIVGNSRIPTDEIQARIRFKEGDPFSWELLERTRTALYGMGVFASVEFDHEKSRTVAVTPMTLRVKESARYELKLGVGAGIDRINYELRARGSYRVASFLVPLGQLKLEATPRLSYLRGLTDRAARAYEASSSYDVQSIFRTQFNFSSKLSYALDNFNSYSIRGPRLRVGINRSFLDHRLQVSLSWRFRYQYFLDVDDRLSDADRASVGIVEPYHLGALVQQVSYDRRDNQQSPTKGWYVALEVEEARDFLGSQYEYVRASPEARGYYSFTPRTVLAAKFRLASTLLIGDLLPITQRYFSGGSSSQRGFDNRSLAPVLGGGPDVPGVPVGGEALIETSLELRRGITDTPLGLLGLVTFVDGADVSNKYENLFDNGLHWATGLGMRLQTIVGTLGVDVGYRLNRKGPTDLAPDSNWSYSAKLGEAF